MVSLIVGAKGKGKTKHLLAKAAELKKDLKGSMVYIDKNNKHMYDLDSSVRLIDMSDFSMASTDEFLGFICGVISQNSDIEEILLDGFLDNAIIDNDDDIAVAIDKIEKYSDKYDVNFVISISRNKDELPRKLQDKVIVSL